MRLTPVLEGLQEKTNTPQIVKKTSLGIGIVCDSKAPCFSTMESSLSDFPSGMEGQVRMLSVSAVCKHRP